MKILLIASYFPPIAGGSAVVYESLCRYLNDDAVVLASWRHYQNGVEIPGWRERDVLQPFRVERIELLRPVLHKETTTSFASLCRWISEDLPIRRSVRKAALELVDQIKPDVVCLGELYALSWLGSTLRKKRGLPIIHYIHGEEITTGPGSRFYKYSSTIALRKAEAIVAVSSFTRNELVKKGVRSDRIHVITNGVDVHGFSPGPKDNQILERHNLVGKNILLTVARIVERKGHDRVIEALPRILESVPDTVYVIVGRGGYERYLKEMVRKAGLENYVVFAGLVPWEELVRYYRSCDVFIMPNRTLPNGDTEGFGLVFLEANACGKPVIGGNAGGVPDAIVNWETGILVDGNSVEEIAKAAIQLLSDQKLAERMGQAGYRRAQKCSWANKAKEFREICMSLANSSPQR